MIATLRKQRKGPSNEEKEQNCAQRREDLRKDCVGQAKRRLDFLLKQSNIFSHFGEVKEDVTKFQPKLHRPAGMMARRHVARRLSLWSSPARRREIGFDPFCLPKADQGEGNDELTIRKLGFQSFPPALMG
jgi:hypothetical protein